MRPVLRPGTGFWPVDAAARSSAPKRWLPTFTRLSPPPSNIPPSNILTVSILTVNKLPGHALKFTAHKCLPCPPTTPTVLSRWMR